MYIHFTSAKKRTTVTRQTFYSTVLGENRKSKPISKLIHITSSYIHSCPYMYKHKVRSHTKLFHSTSSYIHSCPYMYKHKVRFPDKGGIFLKMSMKIFLVWTSTNFYRCLSKLPSTKCISKNSKIELWSSFPDVCQN